MADGSIAAAPMGDEPLPGQWTLPRRRDVHLHGSSRHPIHHRQRRTSHRHAELLEAGRR